MKNKIKNKDNYDNLNKDLKYGQGILEKANKCLKCSLAPCIKKCPLKINIPDFISEVKKNNISEAFKIISKNSYFPLICSKICPKEKQCEGACVRGKKGNAVAIGEIENFVANKCINLDDELNLPFVKDNRNVYIKKKVAVVGSGPAGLSCATFLKKLGYNVTIFEKMPKLGGMIYYGIPEFRLKKTVLEKEILKLKKMGINIRNRVEVGKDIFLEDLIKKEKFDAIFLATGTWSAKKLNIPGEELERIYNFVDFLILLNDKKGEILNSTKNVVVIGGGNVAIDIARCIKKLRKDISVHLIYRRSINELPANKNEVTEAIEENINFETLTNVKEIISDKFGKVKKIICTKNKILDKLDESNRPIPTELPNTEYEIFIDTVVICAGSTGSLLPKEDPYQQILCEKSNVIKVSENYQSTVIPQIFVGGDFVLGPSTVAKAMANGKAVAENIHRYLNKN